MLLPLAGLFVVLRTLRRWLYRSGWLSVVYLPVPVVVIGNITVGGVGKTPLVVFLAQRLASLGWRPGIVSRGYGVGGAGGDGVRDVQLNDDPQRVGDEPLLLRNRCACPVVVGADRVAAAQHLLATHPETQVILSDDGLQHYRLGRRVEIAVTSTESEMNGWPLPAGPMRESRARLNEVDAIVSSTSAVPAAGHFMSPEPTFSAPHFMMTTLFGDLYLLADPARKAAATDLAGLRLHAVAGIGNPQRFFRQLDRLALVAENHAFPDHHAYLAADLAFAGDAILTTEKDAVKLARLSLALPVWVLPMDVSVEPDLALTVVEKLNGRPPA
jgi:tetraacyldisaccharide 4'-kinase